MVFGTDVLINVYTTHGNLWSAVHCGHREMELCTKTLAYPSFSIIKIFFTRIVTCISKSHSAFIIIVDQSEWSDEEEGKTIRTVHQSTRRSTVEDSILYPHCCDNARSRIFSSQCSIHRNGYIRF